MKTLLQTSWVVLAICCLPVLADSPPTENATAGVIEAEVNGQLRSFAALDSAYEVSISGDVVNVRVTQTFHNPMSMPVHARYLFPLYQGAAVHSLTMYVGDEVIEAQIQERQTALATFNQAKAEGKAASLLTQHRPNMFTQRIANLMPGQPIKVTIEYTHLASKQDGQYKLVLPLVVGPRFQPPQVKAANRLAAKTSPSGSWQLQALPDYPSTAGVHVPANIVAERVSLQLSVETPVPLVDVRSPTHPLTLRHVSSTQIQATFAQGKVLDNKDFVLHYRLHADDYAAGLLSHWDSAEQGYFSLLIEPPASVATEQILAREMVFLLDCSGSMAGLPMLASKRFMSAALQQLRPTDTFRIIRFSDAATEFSVHPLPATATNVQRGLAYVAQLSGYGGTMMDSGIRQALRGDLPQDRVRNVIFLTDGYIGNEADILKLIRRQLGSARLFGFGVGAGVNRYLMEEVARVGRGFTRYLDPTAQEEEVKAVTAALAERLQTPLLTDLQIDWGNLPVADVYPAQLPDLYAGDTLRVTGRFTQPTQGEVVISGRGVGQMATLKRQIALDQTQRPALARTWARAAIRDRMHQLTTPNELRIPRTADSQLIEEVTALGLAHRLVTRWTSFVAVSRRVVNPDAGDTAEVDVALPKVAGVANTAYPQPMTGFGAPEPAWWMLLAMLGLLVSWRYRTAAVG